MANFAINIEKTAGNEPIEAIVIGEFGGWGWGYDEDYNNLPQPSWAFQILTWDEARPHLDYEYDEGFGAPGCHAITAWTASNVIFVSQYDGATSLCVVPRNPTSHHPEMPGGS